MYVYVYMYVYTHTNAHIRTLILSHLDDCSGLLSGSSPFSTSRQRESLETEVHPIPPVLQPSVAPISHTQQKPTSSPHTLSFQRDKSLPHSRILSLSHISFTHLE